MLHITDGESVAGTLRESAIPGVVSVYGDMMYEGPAPASLDAEEWLDTRTRFMVDADYASAGMAQVYCGRANTQIIPDPRGMSVFVNPAKDTV